MGRAGSGFGIAVGPLLGGVIVSALGWRWAFGLSAVTVIALAAAALTLIPRDRPPAPTRRFDHLGGLLVTRVLASLVFALDEGPARGWTSPAVLLAFAAAATLAAAFIWAERRHPAPLVDLNLVRHSGFAARSSPQTTPQPRP